MDGADGIREQEHQSREDAASSASLPGRKARILIMDDEAPVRSMAKHMLEFGGYEVVDVKEGFAALDAYRKALEENRRFDAVILDLLVADGLGGMETMERLLHLDPSVKAIVWSGTLTGSAHYYRQHGFLEVLPKPFRFPDLQKTVVKAMAC